MYHFTFSSAIFLGSNFFTPLLTLAIICHVDYSSLSGSWVVTHCGCDFYSPKDWWTVGNSERDGNTSHLTCLLRNLYAGQEATVRTGHGTTDWFQIRKGVRQGCILSPCLFNFYAEYIWEMLGWKKHKLESRLPGEISITSDMQMTPPLWQKVKRN